MSTRTEPSATDELLARLGRHVQGEQKDDARFERVARGEASPEEIADLEREAAADPELAIRLEGSRPFDGAAIDRIAARMDSLPSTRAKKSAPAANVVALRPSWTRRVMLGAGPLALAAAMILYVVAGPRLSGGGDLPGYTVSASGEQAMRGPADKTSSLHLSGGKDGRFELVLRPATKPDVKVVAYAFVMGTEASALDAKIEVAAEGAVRITGATKMLDGAREIRVVLGAPSAIGRFDDALARASSGKSDGQVHVLVVPIDRE